MSVEPRRKRLTRVLAIGGVGAVIAAGGAFAGFGIASAAGTTFYACVANTGGAVRIVAANTTCQASEHKINWNQTGPQGPQGPVGPSGGVPIPNQVVVGTLSLDGLTGPNADGSLDLRSFSEVVKHPATSTGKVSFSDMAMTKLVDAMSPKIMRFAATGVHVAKAKVTLFKPGGRSVLSTYELDQVIVTLDDLGYDGSSIGTNIEKLTLNFAKVKVTVGNQAFAWDVVGNHEI
jgi:type VI protein secretion system component Hcp